jgi:hypothetical protein
MEHRIRQADPISNVEWEKMKKQIYDLVDGLLEYSVKILFVGFLHPRRINPTYEI